jgi:hypothetical protein
MTATTETWRQRTDEGFQLVHHRVTGIRAPIDVNAPSPLSQHLDFPRNGGPGTAGDQGNPSQGHTGYDQG